MKGVNVKDGTWSGGTKLSLDRGQGHELFQRQEWDHVIPWVLHSDGANSSCIVPKMKGVSRCIHLILEKQLMGGTKVDSEECHSVVEADLPIVKKRM
ncbi:hypothetical protein BHM03_00040419 [Ensete ventricosum]|nr:hypothetical protein BHM03_00040419 [Ensete ventricosum]